MDLNHIFLFLAVVSPLLVLARAWRPGGPYRGWRVAALVVLAITGIGWILFRGAAGYIGGGAWFALLFLPAIGLRKMTEFAAQGDYKSARKLGVALQILHPSAELRGQVQVFRHLESHQNDRGFFAPPPTQYEIARQDRYFRHAPAVLIFILLNAATFLFEISFGDWTDPEILHRIGALEPYAVVVQGQYWRLFTALFLHGGFAHLLFNLFALYVLGPPLERSIGGVRFAGHRRSLGGILAPPSSCTARKTATGKRRDDRRDTNRVRPFDSAGQHGGPPLRTDSGLLSRTYPCAASGTCSRESVTRVPRSTSTTTTLC